MPARTLSSAIVALALAVSVNAQIVTRDLTTGLTPEDLANHLAGECITISSVSYTGAPIAAGTFTDAGATGIASGIVLASGDVANVIGPNVSDGISADNGLPGDTDLDGLVPGIMTLDATVLEFDFICEKSLAITFEYVFASDEYNEFVGSEFNDIFGFFLNGTNIALIPATTTPVAINTVNCGNPFGSMPRGTCPLFRNNDLSDGGGAINTEMDGLTIVFSCTATILPGVNHIKLAIADASDRILDSAVFLREGSLSCRKIEVDMDIKPGSCPNAFNRKSRGVLPVAVLGTSTFDVTTIDRTTVRLSRVDGIGGAVAPHEGPPGPHTVIEDAGTPYPGDPCGCHTLTGDGFDDLAMKFKVQDVVDVLLLDALPGGSEVPLQVTGHLVDGTWFSAVDCIRLVPPASPPGRIRVRSGMPDLWVEVAPLDRQLDGGGFGDFDRSYPIGTTITVQLTSYSGNTTFSGWWLDNVLVGTSPTLQLQVTSSDVQIRLAP